VLDYTKKRRAFDSAKFWWGYLVFSRRRLWLRRAVGALVFWFYGVLVLLFNLCVGASPFL
jgi:hypothetical protein